MLRDAKAISGFSVDDVATAKEFYGTTLGLDVADARLGDDQFRARVRQEWQRARRRIGRAPTTAMRNVIGRRMSKD